MSSGGLAGPLQSGHCGCVELRRSRQRRTYVGRIACLAALAIWIAACNSDDGSNRVAADALGNSATASPPSISTVPPPDVPELGEAAVWFVSPDRQVSSASSSFTADVSRLGCNGGVTGTVLNPSIEKDDASVEVTFTVEAAPPGDHTCPGNAFVQVVVDLAEPLGERQLVDGACRSGGEAANTAWCLDGSVRWRP